MRKFKRNGAAIRMGMNLKHTSLLYSNEAWLLPPKPRACWNANGLYDPLQFVLRLRPDVHAELDSAPNGVVTLQELSSEQVLAFSTYFHENIHWWQHVGSVTGLFLSLIYPAQAHLNHEYLKRILSTLGPVKPLRSHNLRMASLPTNGPRLDEDMNIVLNNWHDMEFYRWLVMDPRGVADKLTDPFFDCVGHSYKVAVCAILWCLSAIVDPQLEILPDPRQWDARAAELRQKKVEGFYRGSPIWLPPIGAREIFEGQARFSQLQYLYATSGCSVTWEDCGKGGLLGDIYIRAFLEFLAISGLERPSALDDPIIGLFLIICDIAINPAECCVYGIDDVATLVEKHDCGHRFIMLCNAVRLDRNYFATAIVSYSPEEYWNVEERLCDGAKLISQKRLLRKIESWHTQGSRVGALVDEDRTFRFVEDNLPVRVFLARFLRLQRDRSRHPEFFCWPGIWMTTIRTGALTIDDAQLLFKEHEALFVDDADGDVYPRTFTNRDEKDVKKVFDDFYLWVATYDLTRQWIVGEGKFDFDFGWLTSKYADSEMKEWVSRAFVSMYGVSPDEFEVVSGVSGNEQ